MRTNPSSTLWLELLGGLLVILGALLAGLAFALAQQTLDPALERNLLRIRLDLAALLDELARRMGRAAAWLAGTGAVLFFGANYLVQVFRVALGLAALFALAVGIWLSL